MPKTNILKGKESSIIVGISNRKKGRVLIGLRFTFSIEIIILKDKKSLILRVSNGNRNRKKDETLVSRFSFSREVIILKRGRGIVERPI